MDYHILFSTSAPNFEFSFEACSKFQSIPCSLQSGFEERISQLVNEVEKLNSKRVMNPELSIIRSLCASVVSLDCGGLFILLTFVQTFLTLCIVEIWLYFLLDNLIGSKNFTRITLAQISGELGGKSRRDGEGNRKQSPEGGNLSSI